MPSSISIRGCVRPSSRPLDWSVSPSLPFCSDSPSIRKNSWYWLGDSLKYMAMIRTIHSTSAKIPQFVQQPSKLPQMTHRCRNTLVERDYMASTWSWVYDLVLWPLLIRISVNNCLSSSLSVLDKPRRRYMITKNLSDPTFTPVFPAKGSSS